MKPKPEFHFLGFARGLAYSLLAAFIASLFFRKFGTSVLAGTLSFGLLMPLGAAGIHLILPKLRTRSFLLTVLLQVLAISIVMGFAFLVSLHLTIVSRPDLTLFDPQLMQDYGRIFVSRTPEGTPRPTPALWGVVGAIALTFAISALLQISAKLGKGVLWNWVTGKYHEPREETRIFMFLDLKDSTTLAERLGNLRFSALVRDFFQAMSKPALATGAEVSHYIGDEAVLSWKPKTGAKNANCVRFLMLFHEEIEKCRPYFESTYGHVPEFKAGVHIGEVVATEVGDVKSEIVFHGDVMNTTARVTGLCNELGQTLLVTGELREALGPALDPYTLSAFGQKVVKGRVAPVVVYGIDLASPTA